MLLDHKLGRTYLQTIQPRMASDDKELRSKGRFVLWTCVDIVKLGESDKDVIILRDPNGKKISFEETKFPSTVYVMQQDQSEKEQLEWETFARNARMVRVGYLGQHDDDGACIHLIDDRNGIKVEVKFSTPGLGTCGLGTRAFYEGLPAELCRRWNGR